MPEIVTRTDESAPQLDLVWQRRLDALVCGECSEDDFMRELSSFGQGGADSAWSVVALLDQRYRRGQIPVELFRSIESKIAQRELGVPDYGTTIELAIDISLEPDPGIQKAAAAVPTPRAAVAAFLAVPTNAVPTNAGRASRNLEIGRVLRNRYVLESRLGSGGMGTVFKALDRYRCDFPQAARFVAIKVLHEKAGGPPEVLSSLRREFFCAQALSHPNIVKVYDLDRDGDIEFFTMEFLEGELLSSVIEHLDPLSMSRARAWAIILEVAAGLAHAHERNVVHADLKPQNIMITKSGEVRILDFGASSTESAQRANSSALTPPYASCELLEGQRADPRDDLFALACVAYELLAGQHPFQRRRSTDARDLGLVIQRPRGLTHRQWRTLARGLAWRREDRSISVRDWIAQLQPRPKARRLTSRASGTVALLAALLVGAALAVLFNRQLSDRTIVTDARPNTAVSETIAPDPAAASTAAASTAAASTAASAGPASNARQGAVPADKRTEAAPQPSPRTARSVASGAAPVKAHSDTIGIAANSYRVDPHKNFAEIRVRRSFGSESDTNFAWWTEPSSALPDTDYVPQGRTVQLFSKRNQMASLFVKLVPNVSRKHPALFYVVIGEPGNGTSLGRVTRTAIVLPPQ